MASHDAMFVAPLLGRSRTGSRCSIYKSESDRFCLTFPWCAECGSGRCMQIIAGDRHIRFGPLVGKIVPGVFAHPWELQTHYLSKWRFVLAVLSTEIHFHPWCCRGRARRLVRAYRIFVIAEEYAAYEWFDLEGLMAINFCSVGSTMGSHSGAALASDVECMCGVTVKPSWLSIMTLVGSVWAPQESTS